MRVVSFQKNCGVLKAAKRGANCPRASRSKGPHRETSSILRMGLIKRCKSMPKNSAMFETIARNEFSEMHFQRIWRSWSHKISPRSARKGPNLDLSSQGLINLPCPLRRYPMKILHKRSESWLLNNNDLCSQLEQVYLHRYSGFIDDLISNPTHLEITSTKASRK